MDHLNTETRGEVLLSLKVSFCTVTCYEEEIKAREPFLADSPECRAGGECGSSRRKAAAWQQDRAHQQKRVLSWLLWLLLSQGDVWRDIHGWGLEKAASHTWPPEVNSALQRYYGASLPDLLLEKQVVHRANVFYNFWRVHFSASCRNSEVVN